MYEDDLLDFKRMPWSNPGYRDTEDESKLPETEVHITICPFNHSFIHLSIYRQKMVDQI